MSILATSNGVTSWLQRYLNSANWDVERIQKRLSSGQREDDKVRIGIASSLSADAKVSTAAIQNLSDGISFLNIADASFEAVQGLVGELQPLIESAADSTDSVTREQLNTEANAIVAQVNDIFTSAKFGDQAVFGGSYETLSLSTGTGKKGTFQVALGDSSSINYAPIDITLSGDPSAALTTLTSYSDLLEKRRGVINAGRARATAASTYLGVMAGLYETTSVSMGSVDVAEETAALSVAQERQSTITSLLLDQLSSKEQIMLQIYGSIG